MEMAKETDCLFINIDKENRMDNEADIYPSSIHSGGGNAMANKIDSDRLSIYSSRETAMSNNIDNDHISIRSGRETMANTLYYNHLSYSVRENPMCNNTDCDLLSYRGQEDVMANKTVFDHSSILISESLLERLHKLSPKPSYGGCRIFKVPKHVRKVNEKAYEPQILAIGPYHRSKKHLKAMEEQKMHYLNLLLQQEGEQNLTRYVIAMKQLEERARACYVDLEPVDREATDERNGFVEMMLLDACFIVQLLLRYKILRQETSDETDRNGTSQLLRYGTSKLMDFNDHILKGGWIMSAVRRDLLLVENQLPFFVLQKFFDNMYEVSDKGNEISDLIFEFFDDMVPPKHEQENKRSIQESKHLLDLIHCGWSSFNQKSKNVGNKEESKNARGDKKHKWRFIRCATELREAGIKFKEVQKYGLFPIKFENGIMEIPELKIDDNSESLFRNLIAYEQFLQDPDSSYVIDHLKFLNCLMNTPKDVELLCQKGIVHNGLGDDEVLANMFNRLSDNVAFFPASFNYYNEFIKINHYCSRSWNKWIANLRHKYFNNPWAFISFVAAVVLLILTVAQTVFSVLPYIE